MRPRIVPAALALLAAAPLAAQRAGDTVTVVPGAEYRAGGLKRTLLGSTWRELWTMPVRVPVLDLSRHAGGLTPTERGGGNQTASLRFRGRDGKEYAFRSVNKRQARAQSPELRGTLVGSILQDQVSSQVPTGLLAADRLMDATGALHVDATLYVMPDDPRLGEWRAEFAGMLGTLEERPEEPFGGSVETEGGEDFVETLEEDPRGRVADEEYLTVRLLDLVINDWDRHADQYRWAAFDRGGVRTWRPIPRDRDYTFVDYDGLLISVGKSFLDKAVRFSDEPDVPGLVDQGIELDRRLLGGLDRSAWDSAGAALRARLTDRLIDDALQRLPPEHCALVCESFAARLRERRDEMDESVEKFYAILATEPEAHGTDGPDLVVVDRSDDALEVRIYTGTAERGTPYFQRRFVRNETREVRVWMHGGDDRAVVRGAGGMLVRVLGGEGQDTFEDTGRGRTVFYDEGDGSRFVRASGTVVDQRGYTPLGYPRREGIDPPRDWGTSAAPLAPYVAIRPYSDLVIGVGPRSTRYGFRRYPFATQSWVRGLWAPFYTRFGVEGYAARRWTGSAAVAGVFARASELEANAFYGYGNETESPRGVRDYIVWERQVLVEPGVVIPVSEFLSFTAAAVARYTDPEIDGNTPAEDAEMSGVTGTDAYLALGARGGVLWDRRDDRAYPRRGFTLAADVAGFPGTGIDAFGADGVDGGFARAQGVGTAYLSLARGPVLALRAGGSAATGDYPLQYAATLGGSPSLRGFALQRFSGDYAAFGSAEVRTVVTRANLGVRGDLGVLGLVDAGRVWFDGESTGDWHTSAGGGVFFRYGAQSVTVLYARGERDVVYLRLGLPF